MKSNRSILITMITMIVTLSVSAQTDNVSEYSLSEEVKSHIEANQIVLPSYQDLERGLDEAVNFALSNFKNETAEDQMSTKTIFQETIHEIESYNYESVVVSFRIKKVYLETLGPESLIDFIGQAEFEMSITDKKTERQIEVVQKKLSSRLKYTKSKNAILISFMGA